MFLINVLIQMYKDLLKNIYVLQNSFNLNIYNNLIVKKLQNSYLETFERDFQFLLL